MKRLLVCAAWLVAVSLMVGGCQSPQVPMEAQGGDRPTTQAAPEPSTDRAEAVPPPAPAPAESTPAEDNLGIDFPEWMRQAENDYSFGERARTRTGPQLGSTAVPAVREGTTRVALLLPLSGRYKDLANDMLNAAQLALFDFADAKFELLVHDTKGTELGAAEAAEMAISDGADLILGPLLSASVRAAGPSARAAGINMLAFSNDRNVAGRGVYVMGFLPKAEIERVVAFAQAQGSQRFALLAPDDAYGSLVQEAMRETTARRGAIMTDEQFYSPSTSDFDALVKRLGNYEQRHQALLQQRRQLAGKKDEASKQALARLENLQTVGDLPFDALMVADGGKRLQQIAALLPFYDIDPKQVRILGTGQWDVPNIGAEPALQGAWFASPPRQARDEFAVRYAEVFGQAPQRLATLAYDAAALAAVLSQSPLEARFSSEILEDPNGFLGRDGIFRFRNDGTTERGLAVYQILPRGFKEINPAPSAFAPAIN